MKANEANKVNGTKLSGGGSNFGATLTTHTSESFFAARQRGQAEQRSRMERVGPSGMPQLKHMK